MVRIGNTYINLDAVEAIAPAGSDWEYEFHFHNGRSIVVDDVTKDELEEILTQEGYLILPEAEDGGTPLVNCFTPAELKELARVWSLGFRFIAKDACGKAFAYENEPNKGSAAWLNDDGTSAVIRLRAGSYDALSFEDIAPLHIGTIMEEMGS